MELQRLTSLKDIKVGDCFTMITSDFEDVVIQFIGRNPRISNEEYKNKSGYFATVYGPKKCFILEEANLKSKDTEYYIGYDPISYSFRLMWHLKLPLLQKATT